jgi:hypothetical protein
VKTVPGVREGTSRVAGADEAVASRADALAALIDRASGDLEIA